MVWDLPYREFPPGWDYETCESERKLCPKESSPFSANPEKVLGSKFDAHVYWQKPGRTNDMSDEITVVLVDDHSVVRQGVRAFLETQPGIEIVGEAGSGEEAVTMCTDLAPDV